MKQFFLLTVLFLFSCESSRIESGLYDVPSSFSTKWNGDLSLFKINTSGQIRLDAPEEAGEASLYTLYPTTESMQWVFDVTLEFNPSNANHARIYLFSEENTDASGEYYLQIGSNNDDISFKNTSSSKSLIQGEKGRLNLDKVVVRIKLILENRSTWTLYSRLSGETHFRKEGSYSKKINSFPREGCLKITCLYTKTRSKLFFFDTIETSEQISHEAGSPEEEPAFGIDDISCSSPSGLQISFTREMDLRQAVFTLSGIGVGTPTASPDKKQVDLLFPYPMQNGTDYTLSWKNLKYAGGQPFPDDFIDFTFEETEDDPDIPEEGITGRVPMPGDIVFNELLYDPPQGGNEYIELFNRSESNLDMTALFIAVRKQTGELSKSYPLSGTGISVIKPGQYLLLSKNMAGVTAFYTVPEKAGRMEIPLPALSNTGASLVLGNTKTGEIIDSLTYSPAWHASFLKETKGVSLERIDPEQQTHDAANWTSATTGSGSGTPGSENSQYLAHGNRNDVPTKASVETPYREADGSYSAVYHLDKTGYGCKATLFNASGQKKKSLPQDNALGRNGKLTWHMTSDKGKKLSPGLYIFHVDFFHPDGNTKQFKKTFFFR